MRQSGNSPADRFETPPALWALDLEKLVQVDMPPLLELFVGRYLAGIAGLHSALHGQFEGNRNDEAQAPGSEAVIDSFRKGLLCFQSMTGW